MSTPLQVMQKPDLSLVVTTIFEPHFLTGYLSSIREFGWEHSTRIIVIIDRKTPLTVVEACNSAVRQGFRVECPSLDEQTAFLQRLGVPDDWVPFNTDNRRNIGYLMSLAGKCDVVVSIDDDNFCPEEQDFFGLHATAGTSVHLPTRNSSDGWINLCDELSFTNPTLTYPRGFPYANRYSSRQIQQTDTLAEVAINVGLWLDDPDVDAIGRLAERPRVVSYQGSPFLLGQDTWTPINTQNTALSREAMAAYYYVRMGFPIEGLQIDRYGDILSGYFVQACVRHLGQGIRIGDPILNHRRTPHNLFKDLYHELAGMVIVEELVPWLRQLKLTGSTYAETYDCLSEELSSAAERFGGFVFDQGGKPFLTATAGHMKTWLQAIREIGIS